MASSGEIQESIENSSPQTSKYKSYFPHQFITRGWKFYRRKLSILKRIHAFMLYEKYSFSLFSQKIECHFQPSGL